MMDEKQWGITVALKMYIQKLCVCFDDNDSHILGMSVSPDKKTEDREFDPVKFV